MNEEIDLIKLLKGVPKGTKFYSVLHGEILLKELYFPDKDHIAFIAGFYGCEIVIYPKNGKLHPDGECLIFPSKDNRDWSNFKK